jgi:hypothetical protein
MKQLLLFGLALAGWPLRGAAQTLTNSGTTLTVQAGTTLYVAGAVQNTAGSTLTNGGTVQLTGDFTNAGALVSAGGLVFSGSANQAFSPGAATVAALTQNNTGAAGQNTLSLPADLTVSGQLLLLSGPVRTAPTATLTLPDGATLAGEATGRYVQGNLRVVRAAGTGVLDFGHGLSLDRTGLGQVTATRTAGLLTDNLSRGVNLSNNALKGIDRIWTVETTAVPAAPVAATLRWLADDDNDLTFSAGTAAQAYRAPLSSTLPNAAAWQAVGAAGAVVVPASTERTFSFATLALGRLTVSNGAAPLPVTLVSFTAERLGSGGLLKWTTASELRNDHFEMESSLDGLVFQRLGQVAGAGTSSQSHAYQFIDQQLARYAATLVYYRLRQVDADGTGTYSPVRTVAVPLEAGLLVQAYPNPSAPGTAVALSLRTGQAGPATLRLTDVLGRELSQQQADLPAGATTLPLPATSQLATGVYLLRVQQGGQQRVLRLVRE